MSAEGAELLQAVRQMKAKEKGRIYTPEQLLAISARQSVNLTQKEFAELRSTCRLTQYRTGSKVGAHRVVQQKPSCVSRRVILKCWSGSLLTPVRSAPLGTGRQALGSRERRRLPGYVEASSYRYQTLFPGGKPSQVRDGISHGGDRRAWRDAHRVRERQR